MGKIIACVNEKGGVAKTTTVKNVSAGFARNGKKVLVVDLDPSSNLTTALGMDPDGADATVSDILEAAMDFEEFPAGHGICKSDEGMDIILSDARLHKVEKRMNTEIRAEVALRNFMAGIKELYDYIFIDCPAGMGILTYNALFAADELIIPVQPQKLSVEAMQKVFETVRWVRKANGTGSKPDILGVLFTMVNPNTNNDTEFMAHMRASYASHAPVFDTYIPQFVKIREADIPGKSIFAYAPNSAAAMVFEDLVAELLQKEGGKVDCGQALDGR